MLDCLPGSLTAHHAKLILGKCANKSLPGQVLKKDDDKEGRATVDANKVKEENLELGGGKCWKNIWMVWLEITGELVI